ncbi:MAG: right-handed parallel beta-helix repeat-containing protein, partial [Draconibacterium sp.]|nr:right-handed parallel beta-helix repeat-containing protein [Draconibacterium sp.]
MKKIAFSIIFLLILTCANATNYYLSSSLGNDLLNDGKTPETPWQTIGKLRTMLSALLPGDSVFFKTDDTFYGQLTSVKSGNATKNIYFGSYGTGRKPSISGTTTVSNWTNSAGNIWEATCTDCGSKVTNFFIDGRPQQIGRWPNANATNKGYLSYESHSGTNQITDNQLTGAINWTGAEAVVRRVRWILDRLTIKSHNAGTLVFTSNVSYEFLDGFGYFIQNDPRTLDQQGEWYFHPTTKKISLYSETDPNLQVTSASKLDNLLKLTGVNFVTIENLRFAGSNKLTIDIQNCKNITLRNTEVDYSGENAVNIYGCENLLFESNLINHTNNNALVANNCNNFIMRKNVIKNTALIAGMGLGADGQYNAVQTGGKNMLAEFNTIDSVGYLGFNFNGDSLTIRNNVISNYCMTKDDGGGLYTWSDGVSKNYSRKLIGNIVINAIGVPEGSGWPGVASEGIYIDDRSFNVDIIGNTVYNCGNNGIFLHNASQVTVRNNTVYNNGTQLWLVHDNIAPTFPVTNCNIDSNIFVSRELTQRVASFTTIDNGIPKMGNFDYNYYCRPLDDNLTFYTQYVDGTTFSDALSLEGWKSKFGKDTHS